MRINHKQQELIELLLYSVKSKYPEIEFVDLTTSPDDPDHIWINILADMDEDKEIEMEHFAAGLEADIHINYGYRISIMSENPNLELV